jgi:hypothetical protein
MHGNDFGSMPAGQHSGGAQFLLQRLLTVTAPVRIPNQVPGHGEEPCDIRPWFICPLLPRHPEDVRSDFLGHFRGFHPSADEPENACVAVFVYGDERQFTLGKHGSP